MPKFIQTILLLACFAFATNIQAQVINIPDANFKNYLVLSNSSNHIAKDSNDVYIKIDRNNNNEIEVSEALRVRNLTLNSNITSYIGSIEGINYFSNLQSLDIGPQQIQNINIHGLAGLQYISINNCSSLITANIRGLPALQNMSIVKNRLSTLILDSLPQLTSLHIFKNKLTSFDATSLKKLRDLDCSDNLLTSLNVKGLNNLSSLDCNNNQLVNLDASNLSSLSGLTCSYNQLNNLNMSGSNILSYLSCNNNKLTTLDVSGFNALNSLQCSYNKLSDIFMKNNTSMNSSTSLNFYNNPYLKYVCVDNSDIITVKENLYQDYVYGVVVNSLCSSTLDGTCYSVNCNIRYDNNNDGCSLNDSFFSNIKVVINSNIDTGYLFSDLLGNFTVDLDTGIYTLTPQIPNNYFIHTNFYKHYLSRRYNSTTILHHTKRHTSRCFCNCNSSSCCASWFFRCKL
ncbi:MAG: hypothetical protein IPF58_05915 [Saprospirales bacterium]|nr:hypothetical protein [Saprospirales bacterium]